MTNADTMIETIRARYPDLTADEETAIRHHAETGETLFLRCKFHDGVHSPLFSSGSQGVFIGEDYSGYGTVDKP